MFNAGDETLVAVYMKSVSTYCMFSNLVVSATMTRYLFEISLVFVFLHRKQYCILFKIIFRNEALDIQFMFCQRL